MVVKPQDYWRDTLASTKQMFPCNWGFYFNSKNEVMEYYL